jgi:preprotein translocase subunit SecE
MAFKVYKSGQGYYTRMISALSAGAIVGIGCFRLWQILSASDFGSQNANIIVPPVAALGLFSAFALLIWWLVNTPTVADFLIAGEGEMKKVSWSSRKEIIASTTVVIVVVALMSTLMAVTDVFFQFFFRFVNVIQ